MPVFRGNRVKRDSTGTDPFKKHEFQDRTLVNSWVMSDVAPKPGDD